MKKKIILVYSRIAEDKYLIVIERHLCKWVSGLDNNCKVLKMGFMMHCVIFQLPINTQSNSARFSSEQNKQSRNLQ
jgi:hypothetical protein